MKQIIKQKEEFRPRRQDDADQENSNAHKKNSDGQNFAGEHQNSAAEHQHGGWQQLTKDGSLILSKLAKQQIEEAKEEANNSNGD